MVGECNIQHLKQIIKQSLFVFFQLEIVFLLVNFSSCSQHSKNRQQITTLTQELSAKERKELTIFFHDLFAQNELGYSLFGDKPMSFCWPNTLSPRFSEKDYTFKVYVEGTVPLFKPLATWKNITQRLKIKNYLLIIEEQNKFPGFTVLINKKAFEATFNKNQDLFRRAYSEEITAKKIIDRLENDQDIWKEPLFQNDMLLGIMLGFGKHSAELFQRRCALECGIFNPPFLLQPTIPNSGFLSLDEELKYLRDHLQIYSKKNEWYTNTCPCLLRVTTVPFAHDPDDSEAQALIKKYKKLHEKLVAIFDQDDWLETVITKLCN